MIRYDINKDSTEDICNKTWVETKRNIINDIFSDYSDYSEEAIISILDEELGENWKEEKFKDNQEGYEMMIDLKRKLEIESNFANAINLEALTLGTLLSERSMRKYLLDKNGYYSASEVEQTIKENIDSAIKKIKKLLHGNKILLHTPIIYELYAEGRQRTEDKDIDDDVWRKYYEIAVLFYYVNNLKYWSGEPYDKFLYEIDLWKNRDKQERSQYIDIRAKMQEYQEKTLGQLDDRILALIPSYVQEEQKELLIELCKYGRVNTKIKWRASNVSLLIQYIDPLFEEGVFHTNEKNCNKFLLTNFCKKDGTDYSLKTLQNARIPSQYE